MHISLKVLVKLHLCRVDSVNVLYVLQYSIVEELTLCLSFAAAHLPVVQLNFAAVSQGSPFSREVVEGCFRESLQLLYRALASQKHVSLPFKGVGILSFKNNKVPLLLRRPSCLSFKGCKLF